MLRRSHLRAIRWPVGLMVEFIRSTPLLVQLFFIFYVLPDYDIRLSGWSTIVIGLALHYACYTSETYRAGIESVPKGQWEASTAIHLTRIQTWRHEILHQANPPQLPALVTYLGASLTDAPLASPLRVLTHLAV